MLFAAVLAAVGWLIVTTTRELPSTVATHFGAGFLANGWMARDDYLVFSLAFSILVPLSLRASSAGSRGCFRSSSTFRTATTGSRPNAARDARKPRAERQSRWAPCSRSSWAACTG
jgi:hypothetical protein